MYHRLHQWVIPCQWSRKSRSGKERLVKLPSDTERSADKKVAENREIKRDKHARPDILKCYGCRDAGRTLLGLLHFQPCLFDALTAAHLCLSRNHPKRARAALPVTPGGTATLGEDKAGVAPGKDGAAVVWRPFVTARKAFLSPWEGCDTKGGRDVVRENKGRKNVNDEPF